MQSTSSNTSAKPGGGGATTSKLKSFFRTNSKVALIDTSPLSPTSSIATSVTSTSSPSRSRSHSPQLSATSQSPVRPLLFLHKRVSTIDEREGDENEDEEKEHGEGEGENDDDNGDDDDDDDDDECSDDEDGEYSQELDSDDEQEEDHLHPIKPRFQSSNGNLAKHLSTIMGYCGMSSLMTANQQQLAQAANEESKRTYSLLGHHIKIHKLSSSMNDKTSAINDGQIQLINSLSTKLTGLFEEKNTGSLRPSKASSLYDKYGVVRNLIGKGAYGVIKIVDPNTTSIKTNTIPTTRQKLFVVKELKRRKVKETDGQFIERILSEFVVASTLNYKHIVETVDLMVTQYDGDIKLSQVMQCSQGGDLFTYFTTGHTITNRPVTFMSLYEVDCFIKQIAKGLKYMHNHGVAHCDLKLENILLTYEDIQTDKTRITLKLSDFGKSFVFKTKYDNNEQLIPGEQGPIGSNPYMAPEEHISHQLKKPYSSRIKDYWAFGVLIVVLLNIRRYYYSGIDGDFESRFLARGANTGYLWQTTELKHHHHITPSIHQRDFHDKMFNMYVKNRMITDYDNKTKEWLIKQKSKFPAIDDICKLAPKVDTSVDDSSSIEQEVEQDEENGEEEEEEEEGDELNELRVLIIYKLLDVDPKRRMSVDEFLKSDWMTSTEACS
ncbi:uncharacterized protein SPAPADRAFT_139281 [Spathaspora passalidarum NRRL Y-27907]|uniref:non-specific serine/threonine protein kinase n=1 Tax=Spathaspora passalidarum (strain NRRL Y-27907 / 11-Y1) TaxID=619300 RepID=G3APY1_SPAPN|nr:uncharacterized protein SPAPADRAFT_139281 [Spathaspora passalidarum NRRL Y-27907]EGW32302.1 hypothetical protein SPAPADRAFT_139281 [Spathaspora passalidarum NRRL Y-27907]